MKANVKVIQEDGKGLNVLVNINGTTYDNKTAYYMAKNNLVEGYHGAISSKRNKYIRSNPDNSKNNNLE